MLGTKLGVGGGQDRALPTVLSLWSLREAAAFSIHFVMPLVLTASV